MARPERLIHTEYSEIMEKSYIDYAMSVIISRAIPDIRDGLKPVQRRTLYDMHTLGLRSDRPYRKSARIVGDTMGKYHPHGDSSIYDALVVMAQDFKKEMPLVDGHGNFGSIEGDGAAAMRYTEARLEKITEEAFLKDLDKDVVDFVPNFDETEKEPEVLPVRIPNLLVNGAEGIAVGMATSIPPHNPGEVIDGVIAYMKNPDITTEEMMKIIKGPDFPTGGVVTNRSELLQIYSTGEGKIKIRGTIETEDLKNGRQQLVVTSIPYTMIGLNIGKFLSDTYALVENHITNDITDISDQSSKEGIRIVIELKKGADASAIKNLIYKKTRLQDTFGVNMLSVADKRPEIMGLVPIIRHHVDFQYEITSRKYKFLLKQAEDKKEIEEGLIKAVDCIDLIIEILRGSKTVKDAKECMTLGETKKIKFKSEKSRADAASLHFSDAQADAILQMRLSKLVGLELDELYKEYDKTCEDIMDYRDILENRSRMARVIIDDLNDLKKKVNTKRKTVITDEEDIVIEEKPIEEENVFVLIDRFGYGRVIDEATFERNKDAAVSESRYVINCMNTDRIGVFSDTGRLHTIKVMDLPRGKFRDKGKPLDNLSDYNSSEERILFADSVSSLIKKKILFATKYGMIKAVDGHEFDVSKKSTAATKLMDGDSVIYTGDMENNATVIMKSDKNYYLRIESSSVPEKKKGAIGARGMKLTSGEELTDIYVLPNGEEMSVETENGHLHLDRLKISGRDTRGARHN
jgi:DNA gyrase subunit A